MLEAMREGIPVIATQVGGVPQALSYGKGGVLVPKDRPEALYQGIKKVYENEDFAMEITKHARDHLMAEYSSQKMSERYLEIYNRILSRGCGYST